MKRFAGPRNAVGALLAGLLLPSLAVFAEAMPMFGAPRLLHPPQRFDECRSQPGVVLRDEMQISLVIAADGTVKEIKASDDEPGWVKKLADCAVARLRFAAGTRDDLPEESTASVTFKLRARSSGEAGVVEIDSMGPLVTPPRMHIVHDRKSCFPQHLAGGVGRFMVTLTVMPDGSVTNLTLPTGSEPWVKKTARCLLDRTRFSPGTVNGVPAQAQASVPVVYKSREGGVTAPELRSSNQEIEAAYRDCYPNDLVTIASAFYKFTISTNGRVSNPRLVKGTGDPRLDAAGLCIMPKLEFTPFMQDGRAIRSTVTWELPMRPPR